MLHLRDLIEFSFLQVVHKELELRTGSHFQVLNSIIFNFFLKKEKAICFKRIVNLPQMVEMSSKLDCFPK